MFGEMTCTNVDKCDHPQRIKEDCCNTSCPHYSTTYDALPVGAIFDGFRIVSKGTKCIRVQAIGTKFDGKRKLKPRFSRKTMGKRVRMAGLVFTIIAVNGRTATARHEDQS